MDSKSEIYLIFKGKKIRIPSNFRNFNDVNQEIYSLLTKTKQYSIESEVREEVLMSFIKNWTTSLYPEVNPDNISEFTLLSEEFDRMKDILQLYKKQTEKENLSLLVFKNNYFKKTLKRKQSKVDSIKSKYQEIIKSLIIKNGQINTLKNDIQKQRLLSACLEYNTESVSILSQYQVELNNIIYALNDDDKTADIYHVKIDSDEPDYLYNLEESKEIDLYIPRSINCNGQEYVISRVLAKSVNEDSINYFTCEIGSELKQIQGCVNYNVRNFVVPSCLEVDKGWPVKLDEDAKLTINSSKDENIKLYTIDKVYGDGDDENDRYWFVLSKSDPKSDTFDVLSCADQKFRDVRVPSFIKKIGPYAFLTVRNMNTLTFSNDSQLQIIDRNGFHFCYVKEIVIPASVTYVKEGAFTLSFVKIIKFASNSKLIRIEKDAFNASVVESLSLPSSVSYLDDGWCSNTSCLNEVSVFPNKVNNIILYDDKFIIGKTDPKSDTFDDLLFACRNIVRATVPSFVKRIAPYAFSKCTKLNTIEFSEDSQLNLIDKFAFSDSSIKEISIPNHVYQIKKDAFISCLELQNIHFNDDSELYSFGKNNIGQTFDHFIIPSKVTKINKKWLGKINNSNINISIHPKNKNFIAYDEKFILGKSDINSDVYDVLLFCKRDIKNEITIPPFIKVISKHCFHNCKYLKNVNLDANSELQIIDDYAFTGTSITSFVITENVTKIGKCSFDECYFLKNIEISQNSKLKEIGKYAFYDASIESIYIPSCIEKIGLHAFCSKSMKIIDIADNFNFFMIINGFIYNTPVMILTSNRKEKEIKLQNDSEYKPDFHLLSKFLIDF